MEVRHRTPAYRLQRGRGWKGQACCSEREAVCLGLSYGTALEGAELTQFLRSASRSPEASHQAAARRDARASLAASHTPPRHRTPPLVSYWQW